MAKIEVGPQPLFVITMQSDRNWNIIESCLKLPVIACVFHLPLILSVELSNISLAVKLRFCAGYPSV